MADGPRALLTSRERDALRNPDEVDPATRRSLLGRIRTKLEDHLATDAQIIRESGEDDLAEMLDEAVCEPEDVDRLEELEREVQEIREYVGMDEEPGPEQGDGGE